MARGVRHIGTRQPPALTEVAEAAWQEACRREAVVRPLATGPRLSRQAVACGSPDHVRQALLAGIQGPENATTPGPGLP
jgi:hypothetical protein